METLKDKITELEREEIIKALRDSGWVMAKAARKLGITERMIGYKVNKYGIRTKEVRWAEQDRKPEKQDLQKKAPQP
jgi:transcriptional regulator with GAF, ATPase, and Fis domain